MFAGDTTPAVKHRLGDYLGSSNLIIDETGSWTGREEYMPYGETVFGSYARKRYRFTGKERDEESGLYNHGARYFAPWLCRWISCDPAGMVDGPNLYAYTRSNPILHTDPTGTQTAGAESIEFTDADVAAHPEAHVIRSVAETATEGRRGAEP
jgi:RHS repeat-associated protein